MMIKKCHILISPLCVNIDWIPNIKCCDTLAQLQVITKHVILIYASYQFIDYYHLQWHWYFGARHILSAIVFAGEHNMCIYCCNGAPFNWNINYFESVLSYWSIHLGIFNNSAHVHSIQYKYVRPKKPGPPNWWKWFSCNKTKQGFYAREHLIRMLSVRQQTLTSLDDTTFSINSLTDAFKYNEFKKI